MTQQEGRPSWRRRKFYVHPIQRKYFFLALVPLVVCGFLLALLIFFPLPMVLWGTTPEPEHAATLESVSDTGAVRIWLAIIISMIASGLLSYFATNKFAGPLYRIEEILRDVSEGNLPTALRIRQNDDLQDFAGLFDHAFGKIASALTAVKAQQASALHELAALQGRIKGGVNGEILQDLEGIGRNLRVVDDILASLRSTVQASNPPPETACVPPEAQHAISAPAADAGDV